MMKRLEWLERSSYPLPAASRTNEGSAWVIEIASLEPISKHWVWARSDDAWRAKAVDSSKD